MLTRGQVARQLNLTVSSVRRLERDGALKPEVGVGGVRLFAADEVAGLKRRRIEGKPLAVDIDEPDAASSKTTVEIDGDTAARVFDLFDCYNSPIQVVQSLRLPPLVVKRLYEQWLELRALGGR